MKKIVLNVPDTLEIDDKEVLMAVASNLYERGKLSLGQAAELVGLSKRAFMEMLSSFGVIIIDYHPEDLENDVKNAKRNNC